MKCDFTFRHYEEVLIKAKELGYRFIPHKKIKDVKGDNLIIALRHDIDFSTKNSLRFAMIENKQGIKSTYFVRLHGKYNPFDLENYRIFKKIISYGHEIGLHYAPDFAALTKGETIRLIRRDVEILGRMFNIKIFGASTHEPKRTGIVINKSNIEKFGLEYEAYFPEFVKDMKYISESGGRWVERCMCKFIEKKTSRLAILTHPFWWYNESPLENY